MNGRNPYEIIETPLGVMERWRAETLIIGTFSGAQRVYADIRADEATFNARADADKARTALIQHLCAKVDAFQSKLDHLVAEVAAEREARRADAARQKKFDEEPLTLPPDIAEKQASEPPAKIENDAGASKEPDPPLEEDPRSAEDDGEGDLPKELLEGVPPAPSNYPNPELPHPPVVSQPVSISLNEE